MSEQKKSSWLPWGIGGLFFLLPVSYVLSLGPVLWLQDHGSLPEPALSAARIFYSPLEWTFKNGPAFWVGILGAYIGLWR